MDQECHHAWQIETTIYKRGLTTLCPLWPFGLTFSVFHGGNSMSIPPVGKPDVNVLTTVVPNRYNDFETIPCVCCDLRSLRESHNLLFLISACLLCGTISIRCSELLQRPNFNVMFVIICTICGEFLTSLLPAK